MTGFIYKITNIDNIHIYIGQTCTSLEERMKNHIYDSKKNLLHRPLYDAMRKYGVSRFQIELIEECDLELLNEREIYWINFYNSYHNGYNATLGGEGKLLYDYDNIATLLCQGLTTNEIVEMIHCCPDVVRAVAKKIGVSLKNAAAIQACKKVGQYDKQNTFIQNFNSVAEASQWCVDTKLASSYNSGVRSHIAEVCNGHRKTAYTYVWKYI